MKATAKQFGRNLAEARRWEGLTQAELAQQVSIRQFELCKLEYGARCPRLDMVVRLADALGVQVADLLYGIE